MLARLNAFKLLSVFIILFGLFLRIAVLDKSGGDYSTYKEAMLTLHNGGNPYLATVASFNAPEGSSEHGYAYFPTLLYIQYGTWLLDNLSGVIISTVILWKVPVIIADLFIAYFILKKTRDGNNHFSAQLFRLVILGFWFLNPYFLARYDYGLYDPLFLLFLFLALENVEKDSVKSGFLYALSVSLKTIPIILFPLFIFKTPQKLKFLVVGAVFFILISLPFMNSLDDFSNYLQGSLFVHSERSMQGRPPLTMLTYYLYPIGINFHQQDYENVYAYLSLLLSFLIPLYLHWKGKLNDKYVWILLAMGIYLVLTPVLSRTHILWIFPWLLIVLYRYLKTNKQKLLGTIGLVALWVVLFFYMFNWNKGFDDITAYGERPILPTISQEWELKRWLRHKYYQTRGRLEL